jgi:hypothetical protein
MHDGNEIYSSKLIQELKVNFVLIKISNVV